MKKQLLSCLLVLFAASTAFNSSSAQSIAMASTPLLNAERGFDYALSDFDNIGAVTNTPPLWLNAVKSKVQRSFEKTFNGVTTPKWYALDKSSYLAVFTSRDGRTSRALFSKNGYMNYAIYFGDEKSLPKEERRILKSNFVDYTIGRVSEVTVEGQKIWIVNLEDDDNYVIARIADKSVDELVHYRTHFLTNKKGKVIIP